MKETPISSPPQLASDIIRVDNQHQQLQINHNGFTMRPPFTQVFPPAFLLLSAAQITAETVTIQNLAIKLALLIVLYLLIVIIAYFWFITTAINPTDPVQIQHKEYIKAKKSFSTSKYKFVCTTCKTCVGNHSFHCTRCNRCVQLFDHHCKWLNNCIGAKNYFEFVILVAVTQIYMLYAIAVNAVLCVMFANNTENYKTWQFYMSVVWITINIVPTIALTALLSLHIYLIVKKKSTITLIMENRQKSKIHPATNLGEQENSMSKLSLFRLPANENCNEKNSNSNPDFQIHRQIVKIQKQETSKLQNLQKKTQEKRFRGIFRVIQAKEQVWKKKNIETYLYQNKPPENSKDLEQISHHEDDSQTDENKQNVKFPRDEAQTTVFDSLINVQGNPTKFKLKKIAPISVSIDNREILATL